MNGNNSITDVAGRPFPSRRGFVIGIEGHAVAKADWNNGDRVCAECKKANEHLLTPAEVADKFRVDPKTVTRWARQGKLTSFKTLGGHRRYRAVEVQALINGSVAERTNGQATS
ncbi:MAG TPA: BldC family transcriptional regulator [Solirubrobacteraceae bacterium]|nr:BldC family transcriptional regulator [Solirubrobacteraceae bacterium]